MISLLDNLAIHYCKAVIVGASCTISRCEAISYFKSHTNYDTGLTAKRGDKLITLVTCASHTDNGRFVVVAREKRS